MEGEVHVDDQNYLRYYLKKFYHKERFQILDWLEWMEDYDWNYNDYWMANVDNQVMIDLNHKNTIDYFS
jgi:hypothetical protein